MTKKRRKKQNNAPILKFALLFVVLFFILIRFQKNTSVYQIPKSHKSFEDKVIESDSVNHYQRHWTDFNARKFMLNYSIRKSAFLTSKEQRNAIPYWNFSRKHRKDYWGQVYTHTLKNDAHFLDEMTDSLRTIFGKRDYSRKAMANIIVSFVQDIPYALVYQAQECNTANDTPCIDGQLFGIHTPTEFLYTLLGDCDTRTVLLYGVLKRFGFDVKIASSEVYRHSILAIDLPSAGKFIKFKGKKYYFWETTNKGWKSGVLPPDVSDISKWYITL